VTRSIASVIADAHACGIRIGICGEAPSNDPDFAAFLVGQKIDSMSLSPDSFVRTLNSVSAAEQRISKTTAPPVTTIGPATPAAVATAT
jgi:pyruvate,water dikinase